MSLRYRKSMKVAPGLRVNINKKSVGFSVGAKGARVSFNSDGRRTRSVGIPGTGLYDISTTTGKSNGKTLQSSNKHVSTGSVANLVSNTPVLKEGKKPEHWYETGDLEPLRRIPLDKTVIFDTETTGFDANGRDEILQLSIIDGNGKELYNSYIKPAHRRSWPKATEVNGITPEMVKGAPHFEDIYNEIQNIFDEAMLVIGYNVEFDLAFLEAVNIELRQDALVFDVMKEFAPVHGRYDDYHEDWKWCKLVVCARKYGYKFKAHDAMEDAFATRHCYYAMLEDPAYHEVMKPYEEALRARKELERKKEEEAQRLIEQEEERKRKEAEARRIADEKAAQRRAELEKIAEDRKAKEAEKAALKLQKKEEKRLRKEQSELSMPVKILKMCIFIIGILWTVFCLLGIALGERPSDKLFFLVAAVLGVALILLGRKRKKK